MNTGVLIFAHNSDKLDYGLLATISGALAKKNLSVPVSLATDSYTIQWMQSSNYYDLVKKTFDKIIEIEKPIATNFRNLHDGIEFQQVPFINSTRSSAWDVTPYERTLLIDSDYFIFSNKLSNYWDLLAPLLISKSIADLGENRTKILDRRIADTGIDMVWATTVMFTKNSETRLFFQMVEFVKNNYRFYADLFRFDHRQYRNDIAFSVALHILNGFETSSVNYLPPVLSTFDKDILLSAKNGNMLFMLDQSNTRTDPYAVAITNTDLHIMNKQSIIRHQRDFLDLL
jgi:hypothetical protein